MFLPLPVCLSMHGRMGGWSVLPAKSLSKVRTSIRGLSGAIGRGPAHHVLHTLALVPVQLQCQRLDRGLSALPLKSLVVCTC